MSIRVSAPDPASKPDGHDDHVELVDGAVRELDALGHDLARSGCRARSTASTLSRR